MRMLVLGIGLMLISLGLRAEASPGNYDSAPVYWFMLKLVHPMNLVEKISYDVTRDFLKLLCEDRQGVYEERPRLERYANRSLRVTQIGCKIEKKVSA